MSKDIYIELFHGRTDPEQDLDDWGDEGPILGPFPFCHITYLGGFLKVGDDMTLNCYEDMVYYDGVFYGDFSILSGLSASADPILMRKVEKFNPEKAVIPDLTKREWNVGVTRSYSHTGSVVVTAKSAEDAEEKAMDMINDTELKLGNLIPGSDEVLYVDETHEET